MSDWTPSDLDLKPGDVLTIAGVKTLERNPNRRRWQFWKPRMVPSERQAVFTIDDPEGDANVYRWDVSWGTYRINSPWWELALLKAAVLRYRVRDAWAVLRGKAFVESYDDFGDYDD